MIEFVFTLDYEIYGDGSGSLRKHILEPAELILNLFKKYDVPIVIFVEAVEFDLMSKFSYDPDIDLINKQIKMAYINGHEIGLHIHPQWYNAKYKNGKWEVDISEYNLCQLPRDRIYDIVSKSIAFLKKLLESSEYYPISFRAGNWLFQPTQPLASILYDFGIRIDSSVFEGGLFKKYGVDYRKIRKNGYLWKFYEDVVTKSSYGKILEIPIFSKLVPFWKIISRKRLEMEISRKVVMRSKKMRIFNILNQIRLRYPMKLDFCRMEGQEFIGILRQIIEEDRKSPSIYKPIVAIGHTKDLIEINSIEHILQFLMKKNISIKTFEQIYKYYF